MTDETTRRKGWTIRSRLQGPAFVDEQRSKQDPLWQSFQDLVDTMYGSTWGSERLSLRERCLITVAALAQSGHPAELRRHVIAALRNGVTSDELKELAFQLTLYCGLPVTVGLWREIDRVVAAADDPR